VENIVDFMGDRYTPQEFRQVVERAYPLDGTEKGDLMGYTVDKAKQVICLECMDDIYPEQKKVFTPVYEDDLRTETCSECSGRIDIIAANYEPEGDQQ
jgi:hypothetical protein